MSSFSAIVYMPYDLSQWGYLALYPRYFADVVCQLWKREMVVICS
jgi:hypothetical protein